MCQGYTWHFLPLPFIKDEADKSFLIREDVISLNIDGQINESNDELVTLTADVI